MNGGMKLTEPKYRIDELVARIERTARTRHYASERFAAHQKLSLCTLVMLAFAMLFIPLLRTVDVAVDFDTAYLAATEVVLGVLVLVYALLVGQEKFVSQMQSMHRSAIELDRLARKAAGRDPARVTDAEYAAITKDYFDILEKSENHHAIDSMATRLEDKPRSSKDWPQYLWVWLCARLSGACNYLHYVISLGFVVFVFISMFGGIGHPDDAEDQVSSTGETIGKNMQWQEEADHSMLSMDGGRREPS